ncbi:MAG TPA: acylneuraminate cytidylyltransferase family protein [Vicinamibacterales bacterium]|nr:acylneuraminate cytidylyltransferase family protein [Vicinamibacterales bacterium]
MSHPRFVLGVICCRGGSKGVPRKSLRSVAGRPLIAHAIQCARECPALDALIVSTDDSEIARVAAEWGAQVPFPRPAELAQDDSSKWDVFRHAVEEWERRGGRRVDVLVDLDTGVPMRTPADVEGCVRELLATGADVVATAYIPERNPYFNMVEDGPDGFVRVVKPSARPVTRRQDAPVVHALSPAVWVVRREALWACEHWSRARMRVHIIPRERALDIDTPFDLRIVEWLMEERPWQVSV